MSAPDRISTADALALIFTLRARRATGRDTQNAQETPVVTRGGTDGASWAPRLDPERARPLLARLSAAGEVRP